MTQQNPGSAPDEPSPAGDPWHAFGYLVSGVAIYGFLGWLADRWLGTSFLVASGSTTDRVAQVRRVLMATFVGSKA